MTSTTVVTTASSAPTSPSSAPVQGKLRYIAPNHVPVPSPHNFHLPALSEFQDSRLVELHNMRPLPTLSELPSATSHAQLQTHGFTAISHPTTLNTSPPYTLSSWKNPSLLRRYYIPDTADMLKRITGCKTVITESLLLRSALWSESDALATHAGHGSQPSSTQPTPSDTSLSTQTKEEEEELSSLETSFPQFIGFNPHQGGASPAPKIHQDYAPAGAHLHLRKFHPDLTTAAAPIINVEDSLLASGLGLKDHYKDAEGPRWALYSIWRPLKTVTRDPLALGDHRTFRDEDYVKVTVRTPCLGRQDADGEETKVTHDTESHVARWSEGQRWYWVEGQKPEEVLIIGLFDSDAEKEGGVAAGGTLHSSVELPGTEGEEARQSLELRCLCIW